MSKKILAYIYLFIAAYLFFLSMLAGNFSASHDSINYLNEIAKGVHLFHPHHLLYNFLAYGWTEFLKIFLPSVPTYMLVESFTAIWGSLVIVIVYAFFRNRFYLDQIPAFSGAAIVACSFGVWFYSVNIEVYMPPIFFILLALYVMSRKNLSTNDILLLGIIHSIAVLFHQVNILFALVIFFRIWQCGRGNILIKACAYVLPAMVIIGATYYYVGTSIEGHHTLAQLIRWMQGYTVGHGYWQPIGIRTPLNVATGFSHAFIGGHFLFAIPFIKNYFSHSFAQHRLADELFLARNISPGTAWLLLILTIIVALLMVVMTVRFVKRWKQIRAAYGDVVTPMLICLLVYSIFFCFWMPEILEFWILQSILVWIVLLGTGKTAGFPFRSSAYSFFPALGILIAVINYAGSMRWLQNEEYDLYYKRLQPIQNVATGKDVVIMKEPWIMKDYVSYFTNADTLAIPVTDSMKKVTDRRITSALSNGGKIYVYSNENAIASDRTSYLDSLLSSRPSKRNLTATDITIWVIQ